MLGVQEVVEVLGDHVWVRARTPSFVQAYLLCQNVDALSTFFGLGVLAHGRGIAPNHYESLTDTT